MSVQTRKITWVRNVAAVLLLGASGSALAGFDFVFAPNISGGFGNFRWDVNVENAVAVANPELTLFRGSTYSLHANTTPVHPFWIKTSPSTGAVNAYFGAELTGSPPNGLTAAATLTFTPGASTPDTLYYDCGNHIEMQGVIHVITNVIFVDGFDGP